jgi:tetratricopeptide (TPR) repeat protein
MPRIGFFPLFPLGGQLYQEYAMTLCRSCKLGKILIAISAGLLLSTNTTNAQNREVDPVSKYTSAINSTEANRGSYASNLAELYLGLGRALIDSEEYIKAKSALEKGMQIERINNGLDSLSQSPFLLSLAEIHSQLKNWKQARSALDDFYKIHQQRYGDKNPMMLRVLDQLLEWFLTTYKQRTTTGAYENLVVAERIGQRVNKLLANNDDHDPELSIIRYQRLAYLHYLIANHLKLYADNKTSGVNFTTGETITSDNRITTTHLHFERGKHALEQVIEILTQQKQVDSQRQAAAVAQLGDWYLFFDRQQGAKKAYRLAAETLSKGEDVNQTFFDKPSIIAFNTYGSDTESNTTVSETKLEISMIVTRRGRISEVEVIESDYKLSKKQLYNLKRNLRHIKLRPKLINGEPVKVAHRDFFPISLIERW